MPPLTNPKGTVMTNDYAAYELLNLYCRDLYRAHCRAYEADTNALPIMQASLSLMALAAGLEPNGLTPVAVESIAHGDTATTNAHVESFDVLTAAERWEAYGHVDREEVWPEDAAPEWWRNAPHLAV